jgi:cupin fold WbuC family metalloprotein
LLFKGFTSRLRVHLSDKRNFQDACCSVNQERNAVVPGLPIERISQAATISRYDRVFAVDPLLIQTKSEDSRTNPRKREMHILHGSDSDAIQRMLNALQPESYIRPHRHFDPPKAETVVLLRGSLGFVTFRDDGSQTQADFVHLHPGKALVVDCREGIWHTFFALEPDTVVFECKAGPHDPARDKEFAPWAPAEGSADAGAYLAGLQKMFR